MLPANVLALCLIVFEMIDGRVTKRTSHEDRFFATKLILPLVLFALVRISFVSPFSPKATLPEEVLRSEKSILWADHSGGTAVYYLGKYAARLTFTDPNTQDLFVNKLCNLGWTQYFVIDSDAMSSIVTRLANRIELREIGVFDTLGRFPVWRMQPDCIR